MKLNLLTNTIFWRYKYCNSSFIVFDCHPACTFGCKYFLICIEKVMLKLWSWQSKLTNNIKICKLAIHFQICFFFMLLNTALCISKSTVCFIFNTDPCELHRWDGALSPWGQEQAALPPALPPPSLPRTNATPCAASTWTRTKTTARTRWPFRWRGTGGKDRTLYVTMWPLSLSVRTVSRSTSASSLRRRRWPSSVPSRTGCQNTTWYR